VTVLSGRKSRTTLISESDTANTEYIGNFLNFNLKRGLQGKLSLMNLVMTIDTYDLLGLGLPYEKECIDFFDSRQGEDGTWNTGKTHYVPNTARILMFYERAGARPKKSLGSFLSKVGTWDGALTHAKKYDGDNLWGSLSGYVNVFVLYNNQKPPWVSDFLKIVERNFESWIFDNHQRTHVVATCFILCEQVPRLEEVVQTTLQQQNPDGGWGYSRKQNGSNVIETAQTLWFLRAFHQTNIEVDASIKKGTQYILRNYRTVAHEGQRFGGFSKSLGGGISIRATAQGVWALTRNDSTWLRWKMCQKVT